MPATFLSVMIHAALLLACVMLAFALPTQSGGAMMSKQYRSILQACRKDANKLCTGADSGFKCWSAKLFDAAELPEGLDVACAKWISDRKACISDVDRWGKCNVNGTAPARVQEMNRRKCWREMPEDQLSKECTSSDFIKSARIRGRRPSKSDGLGKAAAEQSTKK